MRKLNAESDGCCRIHTQEYRPKDDVASGYSTAVLVFVLTGELAIQEGKKERMQRRRASEVIE